MGYSFRLTARVLLYASSHRQDNTYHGLCYTSRGALAGTRNSSMGPPHERSIGRPIAPWANALTTELDHSGFECCWLTYIRILDIKCSFFVASKFLWFNVSQCLCTRYHTILKTRFLVSQKWASQTSHFYHYLNGFLPYIDALMCWVRR